ncbi:MAG TPA: hypothetical protein VGF99_18735 [Myxococcota bacterium]
MTLHTATAPRLSARESLLRDLVARFAGLEAMIAAKQGVDDDAITSTIVAHARGSSLWLRDRCAARGSDVDAARAPRRGDRALLKHERELVGRLARAAVDAGDAILVAFCRRWLAAR